MADDTGSQSAAADPAAAEAAAGKASEKRAGKPGKTHAKSVVIVLQTSRYGDMNGKNLPRGTVALATPAQLERLAGFDPPRARPATDEETPADIAGLPVLQF